MRGLVEFPDDGLPISKWYFLAEPEDLRKLRPPKPEDGRRMTDRLAAVRHFREQAGGRVPIMGWVEGALAEAADLRGVSTLLTDLIDRPEWVHELLEICTEMEIAFAARRSPRAPTSSAWGMPSPRRSRRGRTANSPCPTSSASSP